MRHGVVTLCGKRQSGERGDQQQVDVVVRTWWEKVRQSKHLERELGRVRRMKWCLALFLFFPQAAQQGCMGTRTRREVEGKTCAIRRDSLTGLRPSDSSSRSSSIWKRLQNSPREPETILAGILSATAQPPHCSRRYTGAGARTTVSCVSVLSDKNKTITCLQMKYRNLYGRGDSTGGGAYG